MTDKLNNRDPAPAATIILTRQHAGELQVYLLKRSVQSKFMAGNFVFPGGRLDRADWNFDVWKNHVDLEPAAISRRLGGGLGDAEALAYAVAAIRETLEEAGVFLACRNGHHEQDVKRACELRMSADLQQEWFQKLVVSEDWALTLKALSRWSHWITPKLMKRRFDTRFFIAAMPSGQACRPDNRETTRGVWISPEKGLVGNLDGDIPLSPPTLVTLQQLLPYRSQDALEAEADTRSWGDSIYPRLVPLEKGAVIVEPWDPMYSQSHIHIDSQKLKDAVLPVGEPFSRIWFNGKLWRSVRNT